MTRKTKIILSVSVIFFAAFGPANAKLFKAHGTAGFGAWEQCVSSATHNLPLGDSVELKALDPDCQPDTLYTWGPELKLNSFMSCASNPGEACSLAERAKVTKQLWEEAFGRAIFTTINPLATFGYGDIMFRIKLKAGTKFAFFDNPGRNDPKNYSNYCNLLSASQLKDTVLVRYWHYGNIFSGMDYILCGTGPIHSWSVGTRRGYDELDRSIRWNRANKRWIPFVVTGKGTPRLYIPLDGYLSFNPGHLSNNMKKMRRMIEKREGAIFYAPGVEHNAEEHFRTNMPGYWNPN
ncbi:MAG: hypothetical protein PHW69_04375 [Elusimicrobiaceae bacterium]|nr:hypothetical protein [Elusimicrobiaceae bacterium]